jgi:hypothetical protein
MPHRCRCTTTQAFVSGGFSSPTLKDLAAQLKYYPDSPATPGVLSSAPLVARPRREYTRRRLERKKWSALCHTLLSSLSRFSWWLDVYCS